MACWIGESADEEHNGTVATTRASRDAVLAFVRTPLAVRCNVVKVWRQFPEGLWSALDEPGDIRRSRQRERQAVVGVAIMVLLLLAVGSSLGYRTVVAGQKSLSPVIGPSLPAADAPASSAGWCYVPGLSLAPVLWVALPPLVGWGFVRLAWIPLVAADKSSFQSRLAFARHLSGTYLYVYLMILVGAGLMAVLTRFAPASTEAFRWYLWCFLFGESFFVPAAMWSRLVLNDRKGCVFGRFRHWILGAYGVAFVGIPTWAMVIVFW